MKIVLFGDSIRQGYDKYVKEAFKEVAEVYYPAENCRFSSYILRNLFDWQTRMECGDDVDLVHWNAGLWDDLILVDGKHLISLDVYKENVARICYVMKQAFPKAKMIFATSTPCNEEGFRMSPSKRFNADTERYNQAACEIVLQNGGSINDLYALLKDAPLSYHSDQTHFYTKEGTRVITDQVISCIEKALSVKAQPLDYDALFAEKNDALGH